MSASTNTPSTDERTNGHREATESDPHSASNTSTLHTPDRDTITPDTTDHDDPTEANESEESTKVANDDTDSGDSSDDEDPFTQF
jgi:hypothetical protein